MDIRKSLQEYGKDIIKWQKTTYREVKPEPRRRNAVRGKQSCLYIDMATFRKMMSAVSPAANKIALAVMDLCQFGSNIYYATYKQIETECELSRGSVINGMIELQNAEFIRKVSNGQWMLNPAVGTKCYAEDVDKLFDIFFRLHSYTNEKKGVESNAAPEAYR